MRLRLSAPMVSRQRCRFGGGASVLGIDQDNSGDIQHSCMFPRVVLADVRPRRRLAAPLRGLQVIGMPPSVSTPLARPKVCITMFLIVMIPPHEGATLCALGAPIARLVIPQRQVALNEQQAADLSNQGLNLVACLEIRATTYL
jgi:hypothetical protein